MNQNALDYFGEILMKKVRDEAISDWDMTIDGEMKDVATQKVRKALSGFSKEQVDVIRWIIPQIVDTTLHHLLWTLDQEKLIDVAVKTDSEIIPSIKEISDGLAGDLYNWRMSFSKQRYEEL